MRQIVKETKTLRGIDVSTFQGYPDWKKVKADGIEFAVIKATQGKSESNPSLYKFTDSKFVHNITNAHIVGIECSVYHYLTATDTAGATDEAEYFASVIAPYKTYIDGYVAVDVESKYLPTNKATLTAIVNTFCNVMVKYGYKPIVYTNPNFLVNRLNDISKWDLWLALWRDRNNVPSTAQYPKMKMWQWGYDKVSGIDGNVDADVAFKEVTKIIDVPDPEPEPEPTIDEIKAEVVKKYGLDKDEQAYIDYFKGAEALWKKLSK